MTRDSVRSDIDKIVKDKKLSPERKLELLRRMQDELRAQLRAQSESAMVDDPEIGAQLRDVENALESLGADISRPEDTGAATL